MAIAGSYFSLEKTPETAGSRPIVATYYCTEGVLNAAYSTSSVSLILSGEEGLALPRSLSADGARYELASASGTLVFWSKGDNAFLTKNDEPLYTNCVTGNLVTDQKTGIDTYTDASKTFSFSYPGQFILSGGDMGYSHDWRSLATTSGLLLAVVHIPKSFLPGTNFGEAKFTVGTSADPDAVSDCLEFDYGGLSTTSEVMIGGIKFTKMSFTDAGAGNYYDTTSYRAVQNGQCYAIEYTVHSSNIYNYSPDQDIKEFDRTKITSLLENIVQSFRFLEQGD